jgi:hypothetical protein
MVLLGAAGLIRLRWPKAPRALPRERDVPIELRLRSPSRGGARRHASASFERMVPVRPHGDNRVRMYITFTTPACGFL